MVKTVIIIEPAKLDKFWVELPVQQLFTFIHSFAEKFNLIKDFTWQLPCNNDLTFICSHNALFRFIDNTYVEITVAEFPVDIHALDWFLSHNQQLAGTLNYTISQFHGRAIS